MKKKILMVVGGVLAITILFAGVRFTTAYAQTGTPPAQMTGSQPGDGRRHGHGLGETELAAAAKVLGMTTDEVSTALSGGKTLQDLATAAGVDIQDVQDAIQTAHETEMRAQIKAGVADGSISQGKADWLLEGLDKGYLSGPGGFGFGPGGPHGNQPGGPANQQPAATPAG
jgi:hypothetical protein